MAYNDKMLIKFSAYLKKEYREGVWSGELKRWIEISSKILKKLQLRCKNRNFILISLPQTTTGVPKVAILTPVPLFSSKIHRQPFICPADVPYLRKSR